MDYIQDEVPMDQGWAFYAFSMENDGWLQFAGVKRSGLGYVGQEREKLIKQAQEYYKRNGT